MPKRGMMAKIGTPTGLRCLSITGGDFSKYDLAGFWANLKQLDVRALLQLRAAHLTGVFAALPQLTEVRLARVASVNAQAAQSLAGLDKLTYLELIDNDLADEAFVPRRRCKALERLDVLHSAKMTAQVIACVPPQSREARLRLVQLMVAGIPIDEASAQAAARLPRLRRRWAPNSHLTPWGMRMLADAQHIKRMGLSGPNFERRGSKLEVTQIVRQTGSQPKRASRRLCLSASALTTAWETSIDALDRDAFGTRLVRILPEAWQPRYTLFKEAPCSP